MKEMKRGRPPMPELPTFDELFIEVVRCLDKEKPGITLPGMGVADVVDLIRKYAGIDLSMYHKGYIRGYKAARRGMVNALEESL